MRFWTQDKHDELVRLAAIGHRAREIGEVIGCSKNAVIGRCYRNGIQLDGTAEPFEAGGPRPVIRGDGEHFPSMREAERSLGLARGSVYHAINNGRKCSGHYWRFVIVPVVMKRSLAQFREAAE